jgi:(p)ppGpp synthase/HD superfamily hydrolase
MAKATPEEFLKMRTSLKYWFIGKGYYAAVKALTFAAEYHKGLRKDKYTPEFEHQISMACYARTLSRYFILPEETFIVILLHDVKEDYDVRHETFVLRFGDTVAKEVDLITKKFKGIKKDNEEYYREMGSSPIVSIAKGIDRVHNLSTIHEVFSVEKQNAYIKETEDLVLPMLKNARNLFPEQEKAYENIKLSLKTNITLIRAIHEALDIND